MASSTIQNTLALLEERLQKLDFILLGSPSSPQADPEPVQTSSTTSQLRALERQLATLAARSAAVSDVLALHRAYPSLLHPSPSSTADDRAYSLLPASTLSELVLAHESLYTSTSSHLTTLQATSLPDPAGLGKVVDLAPRIEKARVRQVEQARELGELRARSAKVVEAWYESGVLEMGGKWAEWEERIRDCEILVRRKEAVKKRIEEGLI